MSNVLAAKLMLTELFFLFSTFPLLLGCKEVRFAIFKFLSSISHPRVFGYQCPFVALRCAGPTEEVPSLLWE